MVSYRVVATHVKKNGETIEEGTEITIPRRIACRYNKKYGRVLVTVSKAMKCENRVLLWEEKLDDVRESAKEIILGLGREKVTNRKQWKKYKGYNNTMQIKNQQASQALVINASKAADAMIQEAEKKADKLVADKVISNDEDKLGNAVFWLMKDKNAKERSNIYQWMDNICKTRQCSASNVSCIGVTYLMEEYLIKPMSTPGIIKEFNKRFNSKIPL